MKVLYLKYNRERLPAYQIQTMIYKKDDNLFVKKSPLTKEAVSHVERFINNYSIIKQMDDLKLAKPILKQEEVIFEYIYGKSLDQALIETILNDNSQLFYDLLTKYLNFLSNLNGIVVENFSSCQQFAKVFGRTLQLKNVRCLKIANIDLNFENIILNDNKFTIIDYEWIFDFLVPIDFVLYRSIQIFCNKYISYLNKRITVREIWEFVRININIYKMFEELDKGFHEYVYGKNQIIFKKIDGQAKTADLQIFWDDFKEFDEVNSVKLPLNYSMEFNEHEIELPLSATGCLRIDPGNHPAYFEIQSLKIFDKTFPNHPLAVWSGENNFNGLIPAYGLLAYQHDNKLKCLVIDEDPQFFIKNFEIPNYHHSLAVNIVIKFLEKLTWQESIQMLQEKTAEFDGDLACKNQNILNLEQEIASIRSELAEFTVIKLAVEEELTCKNQVISKLEQEIASIRSELAEFAVVKLAVEKELTCKNQVISKLEQEIASQGIELVKQQESIQYLQLELDKSMQILQEKTSELDELTVIKRTIEEELTFIGNELTKQQENNRYLQSEVDKRDKILEGIYTSRSWKYVQKLKNIISAVRHLRNKMNHIKEISNIHYWSDNDKRWKRRISFSKWSEEFFRIIRGRLFKLAKVTLSDVKIKKEINFFRPKIIHAIPNTFVGGSTQLIIDLIEHLGHKYDMEIITYALPKEGSHKGMTIHDFSHIKSEQQVAEFLKKKRVDLLHIHYWGEGDTPWYRKVFEATNMYPCKVIENVNTPIKAYLHPKVNYYVYVSKYNRSMFGVFPENSSVIYPGIDFTHFKPSPADLNPDAVGMVYRLEPDKLREDSIRVFIELVKRRPQTLIYIVGFGTFFESYVNQVYQANMRDNFVFTGYVSYSKLPEIYDKFSIFVAPVWKESFGQVSPFAMNKEMVVAGYNVGALSEILNGTDTLADNLDELVEKLIYFLENHEALVEKGKNFRKRAQENFSVESMVAKYDDIYEKVLEN